MSTANRTKKTAFHVSVHDLLHRPGEQREHQFVVSLAETMGAGLARVLAGSELAIDLRLESVHEGVLASGTVAGTAAAESARTLEEFELPVEVEFQELFAYSLGDGFDYEIQDDHVDLEPVIRDAVVLSLPFQPVKPGERRPTELGEGVSLLLSDEEPPSSLDPRWAALQALRDTDSATESDTVTEDSDTK